MAISGKIFAQWSAQTKAWDRTEVVTQHRVAFLPLSRTTVFVRSFGLLLLLLLQLKHERRQRRHDRSTTQPERSTTSGEPSEERPGDAKIFS